MKEKNVLVKIVDKERYPMALVRVDISAGNMMGEAPAGRFDPQYWDSNFQELFRAISPKYEVKLLGDIIEFITYGQVGPRVYSKKGTVRYIQTINLASTGIDYFIKEAFIEEGSYNDLERSRLRYQDILIGNSGMGGLGKCVMFLSEDIKVNISQDIDILRLSQINPYYVTVYLKSNFGNSQIWLRSKGVGAPKISFDEIKAIKIPIIAEKAQKCIESKYKEMSYYHDLAMKAKEKKNDDLYNKNIKIAEDILKKLVMETESVIRGEKENI